MEWNGSAVRISCGKFKMDNGTIFCPADDLRNALNKLKGITKGELTFNEEYAIEALFHESVHSKVKIKLPKQPKQKKSKAEEIEDKINRALNNSIMEICTQLYARKNYVRIFDFYGKNSIYFDAIKVNGYGYKSGVDILRKYFTKDGELQVGELLNVINGSHKGVNILTNKFNKMKMFKVHQNAIFEKLGTTLIDSKNQISK